MKKIKNYLYLFLFIIVLLPIKTKGSTGLIDIYTSSKNVVVGDSFTITVYCKSQIAIGTCEYTLDYNPDILKLTNGNVAVLDYASDNQTTEMSRTFTFKVISSGTSSVSAKAYNILGFESEEQIATSVDATSVTGYIEEQIKQQDPTPGTGNTTKTYSTNNNLKSLKIENQSLKESFDKDTLLYTIDLDSSVMEINIIAEVEDSKAKITGDGKVKVTEGENVFNIVVTSEKGTTKTYVIKANVKDNNPIKVTINKKNYTVIKRSGILELKEGFVEKLIKIENQDVNCLFNEKSGITLIGLKDEAGVIKTYNYNEKNKTYTLYQEIEVPSIKLLIEESSSIPKGYIEKTISIGKEKITAYQIKNDPQFYYIYARNTETSKSSWYRYDSEENTIQRYQFTKSDEISNTLKTLEDANTLIYILGGIIIVLGTIIVIICLGKNKKNNKDERSLKDAINENKKSSSTKSEKQKEKEFFDL